NVAFTYHQDGGNVDKAFAEADVVVKQRIVSQRLVPMAMETLGVVAEWRGADRQLNLYTSTQIPHLVRTLVAQMLGLEENRMRVVTPEVGGGFGSKLNVYAEEALMGFVAMKINKPVKWIESRRENFLCTIHGRGHVDYYELKMDPAEIRLKNFIAKDEFPYQTATGLMYDSGDYAAPLKKALENVGYMKLRQEQAEARKQGKWMGIGISTYGEICAIGPSPATPAGGWESATVKIQPTGKVTVMTGACPHGQGQETTFAQIAADELGVGIDDVLVIRGDTAIVQYGIGTFGSRATAIGGTALYYALQDLKAKIKKFGAM